MTGGRSCRPARCRSCRSCAGRRRRGRSGASWRRRVDRWRRAGRVGQDVAADAERVISSSRSAISSSASAVSCPAVLGVVALAGRRRGVRSTCAVVVGLVGLDDGFVVEVPAFAALRGAQRLGPFGAGGQTVARVCPHGTSTCSTWPVCDVGAAELDGPDAGAVLDGQVADDIAGQRHGQPLRPGWSGVGSFSLQSRRGRRSGSGSVASPAWRGSRSRGRPGSGAGHRC